MLANLYPALLHRMETTQDRILDAMDRLEIWLDSFTSTSTSGSTVSGKGVGRTRIADEGDRRQREWARSEVEEVDSSDDSDEEEDGER